MKELFKRHGDDSDVIIRLDSNKVKKEKKNLNINRCETEDLLQATDKLNL